jgi:ankyrin repeat protein
MPALPSLTPLPLDTRRGLTVGLTCGLLLGLFTWLALSAAPARAQSAASSPTPAVTASAGADLPVHTIAREGSRAEMEQLLRADPRLRDARSALGATPLHLAATNGDSGALQALIAAGANPNARDGEGRTPLHMAAFATRTPNARLLLQAGADPLLKTDAGRDVLSMARRVRADELAGEVSLWILKGCKPGKPSC